MVIHLFQNSEFYSLFLLPLLIFTARVLDVSLGTLRIIFISKGFKYLAPVIGFFEIMIWALAISQLFQNLTNIFYYIAFAGGFATGNFVGIWIENRLSIGTVAIRIITRKNADELIKAFRGEGYAVTIIDAEGKEGKVKVMFIIIDRYYIRKIINLIKHYNPLAFYSIQDIRFVSNIKYPYRDAYLKPHQRLFKFHRKGK